MKQERIHTYDTGQWSEYTVDRIGNRYVLRHNVRVFSTICPYCYITKAEALSLDSEDACRSLLADYGHRGRVYTDDVTR